jgi:hypothetical protein
MVSDRRYMLRKNKAHPRWHKVVLWAAERGLSPNCLINKIIPSTFIGCGLASLGFAGTAIGASGCESHLTLGLLLGGFSCSACIAVLGPLCSHCCLSHCAENYYGSLFADRGITIVPMTGDIIDEASRPAPVARSMPDALTVLSDSEGDDDEAMLQHSLAENERSDEEESDPEDRPLL